MPNPQSRAIDDGIALSRLLLSWQSSGDKEQFGPLLAAVRPLVEQTARRTLHSRGIDDPAAIDDVVSRVFDHLRRLPGAADDEPLVAGYAARHAEDADDARAYVVWLTRNRAGDVVRIRRRLKLHESCFSELPCDVMNRPAADSAADASEQEEAGGRLHDAIARLEPRQRVVIELLLEAKTQATIAHVLDVCEGTVSRLRTKAVESLRRLLGE